MRGLIRPATGLVLALALATTFSCSRFRRQKAPAKATIEEQDVEKLLPALNAADPKAAPQFLKGFYAVEGNAWRWTAREFSVVLATPANPASGATLELKFTMPDPVIQRFQKVTLQATAGGAALAAESYSTTGAQVYSRDVPPAALKGETVRVDFSLDKAIPPGNVDRRELGVVFNSVELQPK